MHYFEDSHGFLNSGTYMANTPTLRFRAKASGGSLSFKHGSDHLKRPQGVPPRVKGLQPVPKQKVVVLKPCSKKMLPKPLKPCSKKKLAKPDDIDMPPTKKPPDPTTTNPEEGYESDAVEDPLLN